VNRHHHGDRGQSILEFAIVVPLFLLLLFALIDFSRLLFTYVSLANGAREMARVAAVSTNWSGTSAIAAFNNYTIIAGAQDAGTLTVSTGSATCARTGDAGGTCPGTSVSCSLPLTAGSCTLPTPTQQGGFVQVTVSYTFQFNPLFQTRLDGIIDTSFMRPNAVLTTTSRAYVE
jgi:Flp pilus assembly protein TadG